MFGFGESDNLWFGLVGEKVLGIYGSCVHATGVESECSDALACI